MQDRIDAGDWVRVQSWVWLLALLAALILLPLICSCAAEGSGHVLVERLLNQSPQARLAEYLAAVGRGEREAAMACFRPDAGRVVGGDVRRAWVTQDLLDLGRGGRHCILEVQWWNNWCCEPGVARDPRTANVAFIRVQVVGSSGQAREYVFEARAHAIVGSEAPGDVPVRGWALGDVFRGDGRPLDAEPPHLWSFYPLRTLRWEEYDTSRWDTFRDGATGLAFRHPKAWGVAVTEDRDDGRCIVVTAGERTLTISPRPEPPPRALAPERGGTKVGSVPALRYVQRDIDGMLRVVTIIPEWTTGLAGHVTYTLGGLPEDEDYSRLFDALLGTVELEEPAQAPAQG